jgi:hypothetical protein
MVGEFGERVARHILRYCPCEGRDVMFDYSHLEDVHSARRRNGEEVKYAIYSCSNCGREIPTRIITPEEEIRSQGELVRELLSA